ncbi:MAG: SIR2 family protein [Phycisphaeraceae bacterium]|nr:SIR2 family protein [Phycisphaeraceae bacterium]
MAQTKSINSLSENDMLSQIQSTLRDKHTSAPYTMILGSGFSSPLVPTASKMLADIPTWRDKTSDEHLKKLWCKLQSKSPGLKINDNGTSVDASKADNVIQAYDALMRHELFTPKLRRDYIKHTVKKVDGKINPAHIYLASLLDTQFSDDSELWKFKNKFCTKIFTTNFDPLLQRSLQLVNRLYWMTDQLGDLEVLTDDDHDFIQLIYAHGNIFKYRLANTGADIDNLVEAHAKSLAPYFENHGVIVIGYSGWNDCCMEALKQCKQFNMNLYWCDIHPVDQAGDRLRTETANFLKAHQDSAFYVHIDGADEFMQAMHANLGLGGVPPFLVNPIDSLTRLLEQLNLTESDLPIAHSSSTKNEHQADLPDEKLSDIIGRTLTSLNDANTSFFSSTGKQPDDPQKPDDNQKSSNSSYLMNLAYSYFTKNEFDNAIKTLTFIIDMTDATSEQKAQALVTRGIAYVERINPQMNKALLDFTQVIKMQNATARQKAEALIIRSITYEKLDPPKTRDAIKGYTAVIEMTDAPAKQKAQALISRGNTYAMSRPPQLNKTIKDYTTVIDMSDITAEQKANALFNRGNAYCKLNPPQTENAIKDCNCVIEMPNASEEQIAMARINRAEAYILCEPPRIVEAIQDCKQALKTPGLPDNFIEEARAIIDQHAGDSEPEDDDPAAN